MSKGGGKTTQSSEPWSGAQPYLLDIMSQAQSLSRTPPAYYPGATFLGPTQGQLAAWDTNLAYADQVFGGQPAPQFGEATGALSGALTGNTGLGQFAGQISPLAASQIQMGFSGGAPTIGDYSSLFSTTPDYQGLQGAIEAANAPILRQFEQDILPGLAQRTAFLGNPTGEIKTLNRVLPEIGERMALNAQTLTEGERQRALGAAERAAGFGLQTDISRAGALGDYRGQLLGLGQLGAGLAQGVSADALRGAALFPTLAQAGQFPGQLAQSFADWGAGFQQQALEDQIGRFNYYQNLPHQSLANYNSIVQGFGGMGGTQSTQMPRGSPILGAAGGALTAYGLGQIPALSGLAGPWGLLGGAILGALS